MHTTVRLTLALFSLAVLSPGPAEVSIKYESGLSYEMRTTRSKKLRLGETSMFVGGEEFPSGMLDNAVPDLDDAETLTWRDTVTEAEDGHAVRATRSFVELVRERNTNDEVSNVTSELEGWTLLLSRGDDGNAEAELEKDAEASLDEVYLEGHSMEHAVSLLLPSDEVEVGDVWEPDGTAVRLFLVPGEPAYFEPEGKKGIIGMLEEGGEFSAEVTLRERGELAGVECFILDITAELEATIDELPEQFQGGGSESKEGSIEITGEYKAVLWVAVEAKLPLRLELEGELTFDVQMNMDHQGMGVETNLELLVTTSRETEWETL